MLLAYFSRAGENYFNGGRRRLTVGNTEVVAGMISRLIGCDVHRIEAADPYQEPIDDGLVAAVRGLKTLVDCGAVGEIVALGEVHCPPGHGVVDGMASCPPGAAAGFAVCWPGVSAWSARSTERGHLRHERRKRARALTRV